MYTQDASVQQKGKEGGGREGVKRGREGGRVTFPGAGGVRGGVGRILAEVDGIEAKASVGRPDFDGDAG
jgi:hypothetical protein